MMYPNRSSYRTTAHVASGILKGEYNNYNHFSIHMYVCMYVHFICVYVCAYYMRMYMCICMHVYVVYMVCM